MKNSFSLNIVNFTREWIDSLETFDSLDTYNARCNDDEDEGVVATDIMILDKFDYDEKGLFITNSKTYSLDVVKILNNYYLSYEKMAEVTDENGKSEIVMEEQKFIPVTKEELYAIADLKCDLIDEI